MIILNNNAITHVDDVPKVIASLKNQAWFRRTVGDDFGEIAAEVYAKNLRESIGEEAGTPLILSPFLSTLGSVRTNMVLARSSPVTNEVRGFYCHANASMKGCDIDSPVDWSDEKRRELGKPVLSEIYRPGKTVPRRVKLSAKFFLQHDTRRAYDYMHSINLSTGIMLALLQGKALPVAEEAHITYNYDFSGYIKVSYKNIDGVTHDYSIPSSILEPIYDMVRPAAEARDLLFKAQTHIGKYVQVEQTRKAEIIVKVEMDETNDIRLITDFNNVVTFRNDLYTIKLPAKFIAGMPIKFKSGVEGRRFGKNPKIARIEIIDKIPFVRVSTVSRAGMFTADKLSIPEYQKFYGSTEKIWQSYLKRVTSFRQNRIDQPTF